MMIMGILWWTCNVFTLLFILSWTSALNGPTTLASVLQSTGNLTVCGQEFENNVQRCLDGLYFHKWQTDVLNFSRNHNIFREILERHLCRQYTDSLQCIHEMLTACRSDETTRTVRIYLNQSWARQYDQLCDINRQNSSSAATVNNNLRVPQNNSSVSKNNFDIQSTDTGQKSNFTKNVMLLVAKENKNSLHWTDVRDQSQRQKEVLDKTDSLLYHADFKSRRPIPQTGNSRDKFLKFLFYAKSVTPDKNRFQQKHRKKSEKSLLFQKMVLDKFKLFASTMELRNSKQTDSEAEMLIEING